MDESIVMGIFCVAVVLTIISLVFQIWVSRKLKKEGESMGIPLGRGSWVRPFVLGWQYAKQLEIVDVMIFWSVILGLAFLSAIVFAFLSVSS